MGFVEDFARDNLDVVDRFNSMFGIDLNKKKVYRRFPPGPFAKRLELSNNGRKGPTKNCYSTALFLKGVLSYDIFIPTNNNNAMLREGLSYMTPHENPVRGSIVIVSNIQNNAILHGAYIRNTNPLLGYHRITITGGNHYFSSSRQCVEPFSSLDDITEGVIGADDEEVPKENLSCLFYTIKDEQRLRNWAMRRVESFGPA